MANILKFEKKVAAISMLCEGASILAVERITGIHEDTIGKASLPCRASLQAHYGREDGQPELPAYRS